MYTCARPGVCLETGGKYTWHLPVSQAENNTFHIHSKKIKLQVVPFFKLGGMTKHFMGGPWGSTEKFFSH